MDECFQVERLVLHGANSEFFNFRSAKYEKRGVLFVAQTHTNVLNVDSAPEVERVGHRLTETFEKDTFPLWEFLFGESQHITSESDRLFLLVSDFQTNRSPRDTASVTHTFVEADSRPFSTATDFVTYMGNAILHYCSTVLGRTKNKPCREKYED